MDKFFHAINKQTNRKNITTVGSRAAYGEDPV